MSALAYANAGLLRKPSCRIDVLARRTRCRDLLLLDVVSR